MAYNFCQHCGTKLSPEDRACPSCGAPIPREEGFDSQQAGQSYQSENGSYQSPNQGGYYNGGYGQGMYTPPPQKRPIDVAMVILSIVNIIFGCCGIGMILGIIGLVFTVQAQSAPTDYEYASRIRTARILNIIGVVLVVLSVIFSYVFIGWYMELIESILATEGVV